MSSLPNLLSLDLRDPIEIFLRVIVGFIVCTLSLYILSKLFKLEPKNLPTAVKASIPIFIISGILSLISEWYLYYLLQDVITINLIINLGLNLSFIILRIIPFLLIYTLEIFTFVIITKRIYSINYINWYKMLLIFIVYLVILGLFLMFPFNFSF